jgi:hypothetical protein
LLRGSCGFPTGRPDPFGEREFCWEENPERANVSTDAPSGSLAFGRALPRLRSAVRGLGEPVLLADSEIRRAASSVREI